MEFKPLKLEGLILITHDAFEDERGFFMESFNKQLFADNGIDVNFVQDNHSRSTRGILRGLHFQRPPMAQAKLVRVVRGEVFDVAVDLRKSSPTYGQWESVILSDKNKKSFFIPQGFAHGFLVISDVADFEYKVSNYYSKQDEGGIIWNDPDLNINWPVNDVTVSTKDSNLGHISDLPVIFN